MAPVALRLRDSAMFDVVLVATAQHRLMLDQVLDVFGLVPDIDLNVIRPRQTLAALTSRAVEGLDAAIEKTRPDIVLVQGDTTTTFIGALTAFYHQIPVGHVEAGLRTNVRYSPYPEEINRQITTRLATLHFAPTPTSRANLSSEGVGGDGVFVTGNTVIDALLWCVSHGKGPLEPLVERIQRDPRRVILVTAHRRESWGTPMQGIAGALSDIAKRFEDVLIVFPIHLNPIVRESMLPAIADLPNVEIAEPMEYRSFAQLMKESHLVLTDSGGIQEEAPSLGKPVLVMRDTTERPEGIAAGTVKLVGTVRDDISSSVAELLEDKDAYVRMASAINPYGDGVAAERIVDAIAWHFDLGPPPTEFTPPESI